MKKIGKHEIFALWVLPVIASQAVLGDVPVHSFLRIRECVILE